MRRLAVQHRSAHGEAERRFGRRNFMELYAVFSTPRSYTVETRDGQAIGTLSQAFVDRLVEGVSAFLLGGRGWAVERVLHEDRRVVVLKRYGIPVANVFDTLAASRERRGKVAGGHSLEAVCARELGLVLDKEPQISDWRRRPLTARQRAYAALDAEVLLRLVDALGQDFGG